MMWVPMNDASASMAITAPVIPIRIRNDTVRILNFSYLFSDRREIYRSIALADEYGSKDYKGTDNGRSRRRPRAIALFREPRNRKAVSWQGFII